MNCTYNLVVKKKVLAVRSEGVYHRPLASSLPLLLLGPFQDLVEFAFYGNISKYEQCAGRMIEKSRRSSVRTRVIFSA